jgi:Zn-dependent protease with chaperone function
VLGSLSKLAMLRGIALINVICGNCQTRYKVADQAAGKRTKCAKCQNVLTIPAAESDSLPRSVAVETAPAAATVIPPKSVPAPAKPAAATSPASAKPATSSPVAEKPKQRRWIPEQIPQAFSAVQIRPVETQTGYELSLMLVAFVMLLLVVLYFSMIAGMGWLLFKMLTGTLNSPGVGSGRNSGKGAFFVYVVPPFCLVVLLFVLIKPLFARSGKRFKETLITRDQEPRLYALIEKICHAVGAPFPSEIVLDMSANASASFTNGFWGLLSNRLSLTIGMPLAAGMNCRELAGVLAHEFGHFTQGSGLRFSYLIRTVNFWFARLVYERDSWDMWLEEKAEGQGFLSVPFLVSTWAIWVVRRIIWCFLMTGNAVCSILLRQMEYDADMNEIRLAGSKTFRTSSEKLPILGIAEQLASDDLGDFWRDGRLPDNWAELIVANIERLPPKAHEEIKKLTIETKTGWLDTHPSHSERVAVAEREQDPGIFHYEGPAQDLFLDFKALGLRLTRDFYQERLTKVEWQSRVTPVEKLLAIRKQEEESFKALRRFFQGRFSGMRSLPWLEMQLKLPHQPQHLQQQLRDSRAAQLEGLESYRERLKEFRTLDIGRLELEQILAIYNAESRPVKGEFPRLPANRNEAQIWYQQLRETLGTCAAELDRYEEYAMTRLNCGLRILLHPGMAERIPEHAAKIERAKMFYGLITGLHACWPVLYDLRQRELSVTSLISRLQGEETPRGVGNAFRANLDALKQQLEGLIRSLGQLNYPFAHEDEKQTVIQYCFDGTPDLTNPHHMLEASMSIFENLPVVAMRVLSQLCGLAEEVETALGYQLLTDPPEETDDDEKPKEAATV